jgi:hypothetical protein
MRKCYSLHLMLWSALFAACFITACATSQQATSNNTSPAIANIQLGADLKPSPAGKVTLTWHPSANGMRTLTVDVSATGLAPNSTHPEHIHAGTCASNPMGPIIYQLQPLVADAHGNAQQRTIIMGIKNGIPASGWYVNVHNGPTLSAGATLSLDQARPIACANVVNKQAKQTVRLALKSMKGLDGDVHGLALLQFKDNKPVVSLSVNGLAPGTHWFSIRRGTCQQQGSMADQPLLLQEIPAGATMTTVAISNADLVKALSNMSNFSAHFYITVHEAANQDELKTQTGFDLLACGNITVR